MSNNSSVSEEIISEDYETINNSDIHGNGDSETTDVSREKEEEKSKENEMVVNQKKSEPEIEIEEELPKNPPPSASNSSVVLHSSSNEDNDDIEDCDETLMERLIGLTEMFPDSLVRNSIHFVDGSVGLTKWLYSKSRALAWIFFSSASILFLPVMIESERLGIEEMEKQQQRQILLGTSSSGGYGGAPPIPSTV